ncbi:MAG: hypothetical protein GY768_26000 [Planctomycetaceae bacterium]|nr:hypothetical protein [Planctomycetaceae bacterium]
MLAQTLIQLAAALPLIWPGHAAPPPAAVEAQSANLNLPSLSPEEFEQICEIRKTLSPQHRPLADSHFLAGNQHEFRASLFPQALRDDQPIPSAAVSQSKQTNELRRVGEQLDAAANRLERRQLYETADELRELAQQLRALARKR